MKQQKFGPLPLPVLTVGGGLLGFALRLVMLKTGYDQQGVQLPGNWAYMALWILSALVLGGLVYLCLHMGARAKYSENFGPSPVAGTCAMVSGLLFFVNRLMAVLSTGDVFDIAMAALGMAGALCLCVLGALRWKGTAWLSMSMVVTLALAGDLIARFRHWSTDPMLGDYCFQLLASLFSMLAAFHLGGFILDKGRRRTSLFCSMAAVFFSMISLADGGAENLLRSIAMILWLLTGCCSLNKPARPRRRPGDSREEA